MAAFAPTPADGLQRSSSARGPYYPPGGEERSAQRTKSQLLGFSSNERPAGPSDGPSLRLRAFGAYHDATGIMIFSLRSKPASHPSRPRRHVSDKAEAPLPSHAITVATGVPMEGTDGEYDVGTGDGDKFFDWPAGS